MFFLRKYKPRSPGTRNRIVSLQFDFLKKQKHFFFIKTLYKCSGRNNLGQITTRHKGGGYSRKKTIWVDRFRIKIILISVILGIYKQKINMCYYGLIRYSNGVYSYIPLAYGLKITQMLVESNYLIKNFELPIGVIFFFLEPHITFKFFNICSFKAKKSVYARAAGTFCKFHLKNIDRNTLQIYLPSENLKILINEWFATIGRASNIYAYKLRFGKAGIFRNLNWRPTVRGVAMNAVDHPNGGRTKTNKPEKTPWGKIAKHSK